MGAADTNVGPWTSRPRISLLILVGSGAPTLPSKLHRGFVPVRRKAHGTHP